MTDGLKVFVAYSFRDAKPKDQLLEHLDVVRQSAGVDIWTADSIEPGANWREEIDSGLGNADVALLLVSPSFLASRLTQDATIPALLARHESEGLLIIPIIVRDCAWQEHPVIKRFEVLPKNGDPIMRHKGNRRDREYRDIVTEIAKLAKKRARMDNSPSAQQEATSTGSRPLIMLGPNIVAEGALRGVHGNSWSLSLTRFLLGDPGVLVRWVGEFDSRPIHERFIVINELSQARTLAASPSITLLGTPADLEVTLLPPSSNRREVRLIETTDIETGLSHTLRGAKAGAELLRRFLCTQIGYFDSLPASYGVRIGMLYEKLGPAFLSDIIKLEILRLSSLPVDDRGEINKGLPWLDFIERFEAARALADMPTEEGMLPVEVEVCFVGFGPWKGEFDVLVKTWPGTARDVWEAAFEEFTRFSQQI